MKSFATACRRAAVEDFHPHHLRHTCAAWLVSAGVPLPEVPDLLGHSAIRVTER
ncbi:MAG: tyrosine-type recombinase/integrase [Gammaproteobacteria bacterium]